MQRKQSVTLKLTDTIVSVFKDYEASRPGNLEASIISNSPDASEDPGLLPDLANNVANGVLAAEMGAIAGQKGVLVVGAYQGVKVLAQHVWRYFSENKTDCIDVYNLTYLNSTQFTHNNNIGVDDKQIAMRLNVLQKIYNHAFAYQQLKGTRFGFRLFGLTVGEHRDDHLIDDYKYLVNILIGRKIRLAAEARDSNTYRSHLQHLYSFLEKIAQRPEILASQSNDTTYASLRSVINMVKKDLLELDDKEETEATATNLLKVLDQDINQTLINSAQLIEEVRNRTTYLSCDTTPNDFFDYLNADQYNQNLAKFANFATPFYKTLLESLYQHKDLNEEQLNEFANGISHYAGIKLNDEKKQALKNQFANILQTKNRLYGLLVTLRQLNEIKNLGGLTAFIEITDELKYLLEEIKIAQAAAIKNQKVFVDLLSSEFSNSSSQSFKNQFTAHGYKRLLIDVEPINDAMVALSQINLNKKAFKLEAKVALDTLIARFKRSAQKHGFNPIHNQSEDNTKLEDDDNDDLLKSWVEVNLQASHDDFAEKLPDDVKQLPWYKKIYQSAVASESNALKRQITAKDEKIAILTNENNKLKREAGDHEKAVVTLNNSLANANAQIENEKRAAAKRNLQTRLKIYQQDFDHFIEDYLKTNKSSSCFSWFHYHGKHGRKSAKNFSHLFKAELNNLAEIINKEENPTIDWLRSQIKSKFIALLSNNQALLDGNYHPHSLKTYLLAYYDYLNANIKDNMKIKEAPLKLFFEQGYVATKNKNVRELYENLIQQPKLDPPRI